MVRVDADQGTDHRPKHSDLRKQQPLLVSQECLLLLPPPLVLRELVTRHGVTLPGRPLGLGPRGDNQEEQQRTPANGAQPGIHGHSRR